MAASSDDNQAGKRGPGLAVPLIIMTVLGAGAGLACGMFLLGAKAKTMVAAKAGQPEAKMLDKSKAKDKKKSKKADKKKGKAGKGKDKADKGKKDKKGGKAGKGDKDGKQEKKIAVQRAIDIPPVIASIGHGKQAWIRMELKAISREPEIKDESVLMLKISQDILSYIRTLNIGDIQSANGFYLLRSNLEEIARIRSKGAVSGIAIQGFIVE